ncbi:MAG: DUF922 domain-containing protein [Nitrospirota bacterium]
MARLFYICFLPALIILSANAAYAGISQIFDKEGNPVLSSQKGISEQTSGSGMNIPRYSVPEGVELLKDIKYEYYPVFGRTFSEIITSSEENGPFNREENRRFPTKSEWNIGWSYKFVYSYEIDEENNKIYIPVEIYDINVKYDITITLPTLIDDTSLNPVEKKMWKNYFLRLLEHEHDHVKIIRDVESMDKTLKNITDISYMVFDFKSDLDLERIVESSLEEETLKIGRTWLSEIKKRTDEYDRITDHGKKIETRELFFKQKGSD